MKLSATIITLNEESNIYDCLKSLSFVDEVVVVDSGSADQTETICRSFDNVQYSFHAWEGFGKQKNIAASLAKHDWILNIDADERISPTLREAISCLNIVKTPHVAYRMARENYFGPVWVRYGGWYPDYNIRLYNRNACAFSERAVHESLICQGSIETLSGNLVHKTYRDTADFIERQYRYAGLFAREYENRATVTPIPFILFKALYTFLKMFIMRRGFLDGVTGAILALLYSQYTITKYLLLNERISLVRGKRNRRGE